MTNLNTLTRPDRDAVRRLVDAWLDAQLTSTAEAPHVHLPVSRPHAALLVALAASKVNDKALAVELPTNPLRALLGYVRACHDDAGFVLTDRPVSGALRGILTYRKGQSRQLNHLAVIVTHSEVS